jgi:hypothetical protein
MSIIASHHAIVACIRIIDDGIGSEKNRPTLSPSVDPASH